MFLWFAFPVDIYSIQRVALRQNVTERDYILLLLGIPSPLSPMQLNYFLCDNSKGRVKE
jgi:hypothetical protein